MRNILKPIFILFSLVLLVSPLWSQKTTQELKQLNKAIRKTWDIDKPIISLLDSNTSALSTMSLNGEIFIVKKQNITLGYAYIGKVFSCRAGGCTAEPKLQSEDDFEYFDYLILLNNDISVELVRIFNYQATHGQEVCNPSWLKQFKAYDGKTKLDYGNEIDAISGATISAISIIVDVENVVDYISQMINTTALQKTK